MRSALGQIKKFGDLRGRVEIFSKDKTPCQMSGAIEDVGEAVALAGRIVELCTVLVDVDLNASSVDLRHPQRRVPRWGIGVAVCSSNGSQGGINARHQRVAGLDRRIYDLRAECQSRRGRCDADQESSYRCDQSSLESFHGFFLSRLANQKSRSVRCRIPRSNSDSASNPQGTGVKSERTMGLGSGCCGWYDSRRRSSPFHAAPLSPHPSLLRVVRFTEPHFSETGRNGLRDIQMASVTQGARFGAAGTGDTAPRSRAAQRGIFGKEGEFWTVGYGGKAFRLKDSKGLGYLAHLLRHPAAEFHVLDLVGGIASQREEDEISQSVQGLPRGAEDLKKAGIHITSLGDAGEMLDEQAKVAYRRRLSELREELEEAKEVGNVERAEQAEEEIDALTRELSRAVGLGGRNRRAASASERARQSITKTIKAVIERITESDAALGDIFARCIRTGIFCSYQPDPEFPIGWEFAAPIIEPSEQPTSSGEPDSHVGRTQDSAVVLDVSPFSPAERTAFVGRETERSAIRAAIVRALSGQGSVIMLGGGPGVGKTRLTIEMAEYACRVGFRCSVGHCYERDEP